LQVVLGTESEILVKDIVDRDRARRACQQGVAIASAVGDDFSADIAARAGAVFDDDGLPPLLSQLLGDNARQGIGCATGGERHDDLDSL